GTLERGDYESVAHRWLSSEPGEGVERSWGHARPAAGGPRWPLSGTFASRTRAAGVARFVHEDHPLGGFRAVLAPLLSADCVVSGHAAPATSGPAEIGTTRRRGDRRGGARR